MARRHIAIFPFMAQGHTIPLIDLSKSLSQRYNIRVTIITTPSNSNSIRTQLSKPYPNITLTELPFPTNHGLPAGCENTSQLPSMSLHPNFLLATKHLQKPFSDLLRDMRDSRDSLPLCVVSDFFLGFTLKVCRDFGVPRLVFHGMGVLPMSICKASWAQKRHFGDDPQHLVDFSGLLELPFAVTRSDLPFPMNGGSSSEVVRDRRIMTQFIDEVGEADLSSWGVIVNSFVEAELGQLSFFESLYSDGARAWCVGPLGLLDDSEPSDREETTITRWLGDRGSVMYVSFGSQSEVSEAQLDEVAYGLEESGESFLWVVRSNAWSPPNDIKERLNDKGLIVSEWVDQRRILAHVAVGGFLSHCGWNSVMESLSAGVPILAWPMLAEQGLNAKLVVEGLGAGIRIEKPSTTNNNNNNGVVSRDVICKGVRDLMGPTEKGRRVREKAAELKGVARRAIGDGGSSWKTLNELVEKLLKLGS